jgi:hypothetical protein
LLSREETESSQCHLKTPVIPERTHLFLGYSHGRQWLVNVASLEIPGEGTRPIRCYYKRCSFATAAISRGGGINTRKPAISRALELKEGASELRFIS